MKFALNFLLVGAGGKSSSECPRDENLNEKRHQVYQEMLVSLCMQAHLMEHEDYRSWEKFNLRDFEKTAKAEKFYTKIVLWKVMQPGS